MTQQVEEQGQGFIFNYFLIFFIEVGTGATPIQKLEGYIQIFFFIIF
jgi:hypothetical protein